MSFAEHAKEIADLREGLGKEIAALREENFKVKEEKAVGLKRIEELMAEKTAEKTQSQQQIKKLTDELACKCLTL